MSSEKSKIINSLIQIYNLNKINNILKANENIDDILINREISEIDDILINREISELEERLIDLPKKGSGVFASQKEFAKLLIFLKQLYAGNYSKKHKNDINQLLKALYKSTQISELVYKN